MSEKSPFIYYKKQRKASKESCKRHQALSEEEKNKKQEYGQELS